MKSGNSKQLSESLVISCYKISNNSRYCLCTYTGMHMWDYVWYFAAENICRQVDSKPLYWWFYGDTLSSYLATDGQQAIYIGVLYAWWYLSYLLLVSEELSNISISWLCSIFWNLFPSFKECKNLWSLPRYSR